MPWRVSTTTLAFGLTVLVWLFLTAGRLDAAATSPNYFIRTWQVENGLPQSKVTAVVQARDGYLWLGTYNGLARFDGVRFAVFDDHNTPALRSSRITSLFEAADGTLWIGDESGQLTKCKDGRFEAVPFHADWSGGKIYEIAGDEAGDVWLLNEAGELARVRDGQVLLPPTGGFEKVVSLTRSPDGKVWIARNGRVSALEHGQLLMLNFGGGFTNGFVQGMAASHDGGLWIASDGQFQKWKDGQWIGDRESAPWGRFRVLTRLVETRNGALFGGTSDDGLYLVFPGQGREPLHFGRANRFPSDWVISLCEDQEGDVWSGTGAGLAMVRSINVEVLTPPDQWQNRAVLSVCARTNGALWIGTEGAGLYSFQDGKWANFGDAQGLQNPYVWSVAEDEEGRVWAGTWGGGLFVQNGSVFKRAPGTENFTLPMPALLWNKGVLLIGSSAGSRLYQNGRLTLIGQGNQTILKDVRAIAADPQGAIWFGTAGSGLACCGQTFRLFTKSNGLSSDFIECLLFDKTGALWIGTFGGGLNRLKNGKFSVISRNQGLPNSIIGDIESDDRGYFWLSSYDGIIRVSEEELNRCADGKIKEVPCLTYGINDGLPTLECSEGLQPAGCKTADGRLWFATAKGLVVVDPTGVRTNSRPPPVLIEEMRVDGQPFASGVSGASLKVPPGRHRFEFQYTGLSFVVPEKVRFKCRLRSSDADWVDEGNKRLASYNYIPPGAYSFQVAACNNDGIWNETGVSLDFEVLPYFWQTAWFRTLAVAVLIAASGGLVWFDTRRRMRRKLERAERQRDIERERSRIAQDIHDDLGAQLTRITMMSESARGNLGDSSKVASGLQHIYDTAHQLTRSMDEIVWAVDPRYDTLEGLAAYLEKFAHDWLATAGIRCRLDLPVHFPEWRLTAEVRHNLFLACKEALHNVVKHSAATEVYIRLVLQETSFSLEIEDNGRGFAADTMTPRPNGAQGRISTGHGLENMARRLAKIGGAFDVQGVPGAGTKVVFKVRLKVSPP